MVGVLISVLVQSSCLSSCELKNYCLEIIEEAAKCGRVKVSLIPKAFCHMSHCEMPFSEVLFRDCSNKAKTFYHVLLEKRGRGWLKMRRGVPAMDLNFI